MVTNWKLNPSDGHEPSVALLLAVLDDGTREWLDELDSPSRDNLKRRLSPTGPSIGEILIHIAAVEAYWIWKFICAAPPEPELRAIFDAADSDVDAYKWGEAPDWEFEQYLDLLKKVRGRTHELLQSERDLNRVVPREDGKTFTVGWVVGHVLQHDSYHGGQAVQLHQHWRNLDGEF